MPKQLAQRIQQPRRQLLGRQPLSAHPSFQNNAASLGAVLTGGSGGAMQTDGAPPTPPMVPAFAPRVVGSMPVPEMKVPPPPPVVPPATNAVPMPKPGATPGSRAVPMPKPNASTVRASRKPPRKPAPARGGTRGRVTTPVMW